MSGRFFLDTNIFVYRFDDNSPAKQQLAEQLIRRALTSHKGVVSYQVVQEFMNVALRRLTPPMRASEAEEYLTTVFHPLLAIHSSAALYRHALNVHDETKFPWYDSLIVSAAMQAECTTLFSEDLRHGRRIGSLTITNPFL
jgi:predicted nucleic acid-binding protein